jgi:deoxyribonuclease-4
MADHPRFGPAGIPAAFKTVIVRVADIPRLLRNEGLDAFEYQAVRWGTKPQMRKEEAEKLGLEAKASDVWLSVHASYFIDFCGAKSIVEASKQRLIACATAAKWMNAHVVVFHPGFYGGNEPRKVFRNCLKPIKEVIATMKTSGLGDVRIGPETMGRLSQFGSLDDVLRLCKEVEQMQLVIDWGHLHARDKGCFRNVQNFRGVIEHVEDALGTEAARNMHCHFTRVEFSASGERRHHTMEEAAYGPDFEMFAKVIAEFKLNPVVISESPVQDVDAIKMRDLVKNELKLQSSHMVR